MSIIGISGKLQSGKDEVCKIIKFISDSHNSGFNVNYNNYKDYLKNKHDLKCFFKTKKFADSLKDVVCILTGCNREQLENIEFKNSKLSNDWIKSNEEDLLTYRQLLQYLGTDLLRYQLHQNVWVNSLISKYNNKEDHWIISDVRFKNECKAIKNNNGIIIRINRDTLNNNDNFMHISEKELDDFEFDYIIDNNGDIEDLIHKVEFFMLKFKIIQDLNKK